MLKLTPKDKQENKVLQILQELARLESVTPAQWLGIRIMREAKEKGLIKPAQKSRPTKSKQKPAVRLENGSFDEFVTED
jgi:hypothetical protein